MKTRIVLILLATPLVIRAQEDTTRTAPAENEQRIELRMSSQDGLDVQVTETDTTRKGDPITITTKNRKITITSEPREWGSETDSIADRLRDLRRDRRRMFTYWSGVDVGVNTLLGSDGDADLDSEIDFMEIANARSRFLAINFWETKLEFGSHHAGLLTGLGVEFLNYHLKHDMLLQQTSDSVFALPLDAISLRKNKLRQIGLRVPLMLEFNTKRAPLPSAEELKTRKAEGFDRKRNVHLAAGVIGSWYFDNMYKQKFEQDGEMHKQRQKGRQHLEPYRLAASVRLGYGAFNLFAEYSLTQLFRPGNVPDVTPLNLGLTIIGFN